MVAMATRPPSPRPKIPLPATTATTYQLAVVVLVPHSLQLWDAYLLATQSAPKNASRGGGKRKGPVQADPRRKSIPAVVGPSWAARQAREDRITGNVCLTYEDFLRTYGLRESDASRRVWKAYHERAKLAPRSTPPKSAQKSNWARGLTLTDTSARRRTRKAVRLHRAAKERPLPGECGLAHEGQSAKHSSGYVALIVPREYGTSNSSCQPCAARGSPPRCRADEPPKTLGTYWAQTAARRRSQPVPGRHGTAREIWFDDGDAARPQVGG